MRTIRSSWSTLAAFAAAATAVACVGSSSVTNSQQGAFPYAILYGTVITSDSAFDVTIGFEAFVDSADALAGTNVFGVVPAAGLSGTDSYLQTLVTTQPRVLYVNVSAGAVIGTKEVTDTVKAIRVRFDTLGGGPHDSVQVNVPLH